MIESTSDYDDCAYPQCSADLCFQGKVVADVVVVKDNHQVGAGVRKTVGAGQAGDAAHGQVQTARGSFGVLVVIEGEGRAAGKLHVCRNTA